MTLLSKTIDGRKLLVEFRCDVCNKIFLQRFFNDSENSERYLSRDFHFDTKECSLVARKNGGVIYEKYRQTLTSRYGADNPSRVQEFKEKREATTLQRFGTKSWFQRRDLVEERMLNIFGVSNPLKHPEIKKRVEQTCIERYGVSNAYLKPDVFEKCHAPEAFVKAHETKTQNGSYKIACEKTHKKILASGGYANIVAKRHATMKKNGSFIKSAPEDICFRLLIEAFCETDVKRHQLLNGWNIDFKIESINTYIQVDGVYWHAKGDFLEKILSSTCPRSKVILKTVERDKKQNDWVKQNSIKFLRITDKEIKNITSTELKRKIVSISAI